jgi:hypothetical protein
MSCANLNAKFLSLGAGSECVFRADSHVAALEAVRPVCASIAAIASRGVLEWRRRRPIASPRARLSLLDGRRRMAPTIIGVIRRQRPSPQVGQLGSGCWSSVTAGRLATQTSSPTGSTILTTGCRAMPIRNPSPMR